MQLRMSSPQRYGSYDPEDLTDKTFEFDDKTIRRAFIRKVYAILFIQLNITLGAITLFMYCDPIKQWVRAHPHMIWVALGTSFATLLIIVCCGQVRRKVPMNYIFLLLFTLAMSFVLGVTTASFNLQEIMLAVAITAAVCLGLTLFAFQTKWDFTVMGGILVVALIVLVLFGIIAMFFPNRILTIVYSSAGALLFSICLVYDTQLIMGGEHKYSISPEEYVFAALTLYLDVVNIFMHILQLIGVSRN
ncbi:protein lifeguard 2-like [Toxorhynchites rutilus septentrionalis]|uniref:protein lifeguard 2-like n=1 Tax=Toxorhynchites rutilus septentrionalis TaxID=329112 RepID=UPI0024794158|nr:protein lifeguard 2-like [Toxorhynchites rutilus septentrionalis]